MLTLIYVIFTFVCIFLIITVLLQPGKAGGLGAAFGGGSNTVFGASGGTPVFRRMTTGAAVIFMLLSLLLAYLSIDRSVTKNEDTSKKRGLDFSSYSQEAADEDIIPIPAALQNAPAPVDSTGSDSAGLDSTGSDSVGLGSNGLNVPTKLEVPSLLQEPGMLQMPSLPQNLGTLPYDSSAIDDIPAEVEAAPAAEAAPAEAAPAAEAAPVEAAPAA
jgi:preprotein translocase subunit SecG